MADPTREIDRGERRIQKMFKEIRGAVTTVGIHKDAGDYPEGKNPQPVAQIAFWNEFGTSTSPSRPWMRSTIDVNKQKLFALNVKLFGKLLDGTLNTRQALDRLGFSVKTRMQNRVMTAIEWAEANALSTAAQKRRGGAIRGAAPLIRTLRLFKSITHKVKLK